MLTNLKNIILFQSDGFEFNLIDLILIVALLVIGFFVMRVIRKLISRQSAEKHLSSRFTRFLYQGGRLLIWTTFFLLILKVLDIQVSSVLGYELYADEKFQFKLYNILLILIILYVISGLSFAVEYWFDSRIDSKKLDIGRGKSFLQIVKYVIWMVGIVIVIGSLGFKVTLLVASVSALLIGVGFGLQHIFNDFFSGVIILFDGSVKVNDVVEMEGVVGRVLEIGVRVSKILTRDNVVIIVPNSRFTGQHVINWSHNADVTRFYVGVGVAYGSDVRLVERILLEAAKNHSMIVKTPAPFVRFKDFGESSLDFELYFWTANDFLVENIKSDLRFEIDHQFRENKVEIPFPQRDLHFKTKNFD
ncbi:mechanosensitive ion channel family protein [Sunxiuqinia dokdonensis]|uniref:Small mechanosensitive ion channel protein MscS n=1 Tax=Sunxiuqinia dokdonensis TaxID=1409788 RepID=A0A0L8V880_9BACT|nr:mechanosensitive ion channel domain-containing protein [Sunxiuqinia dokdonensis]KOH44417.1 small mechanosensitive ion channel protein MscS [Sunxiuqinia dokdonensis]